MKIEVTCKNCQRVMRVASEHIGKKGKCPKCGTINLIKEDAVALPVEEDIPVAKLLPENPPLAPPSQNPYQDVSAANPFGNAGSGPIGNSDFESGASPYQAPSSSGGRSYSGGGDQTDLPGVLSLVFGGLSFLSLMLCFCFGPLGLIALIGSIAGLILGFYAKPPLRMPGILVNSIVLGICLLVIVAGIVVAILAMNGAFDPAGF